jgi:hypothetical protein
MITFHVTMIENKMKIKNKSLIEQCVVMTTLDVTEYLYQKNLFFFSIQ